MSFVRTLETRMTDPTHLTKACAAVGAECVVAAARETTAEAGKGRHGGASITLPGGRGRVHVQEDGTCSFDTDNVDASQVNRIAQAYAVSFVTQTAEENGNRVFLDQVETDGVRRLKVTC